MNLSNEQEIVFNNVMDWYSDWREMRKRFITVGGYAGTGKSFLISHLKEELPKGTNIAFAAPTGRAAASLKRKMIENKTFNKSEFCGTIHSLIYRPKLDPDTKLIIGWDLKEDLDYDLIIIDEGSMVSEELWNDLNVYGIPIIVVGDHGQLYPVSEKKFSLMIHPDLMLTQIHRQAANNPIINMSMNIRKNGYIQSGIHAQTLFKFDWSDNRCQSLFNSTKFDDDTICLCGRNNTRFDINNRIRKNLKFTQEAPYPGEKLVCLSNNHKSGMMNGELFTLMWLTHFDKYLYEVALRKEGEEDLYSAYIMKTCFGCDPKKMYEDLTHIRSHYTMTTRKNRKVKEQGISLFDFGYCVTVHKSQGSEWEKVILFEERNRYQDDEDWRRWLYTGVTRSKEKLFIIDGY